MNLKLTKRQERDMTVELLKAANNQKRAEVFAQYGQLQKIEDMKAEYESRIRGCQSNEEIQAVFKGWHGYE